jgi:hypothetical protein
MHVSSLFLKRVALSFVRAFAASLLTFLIGIATAPEWTFSKAAAVSALVGAITAGLRAIQHVLET